MQIFQIISSNVCENGCDIRDDQVKSNIANEYIRIYPVHHRVNGTI